MKTSLILSLLLVLGSAGFAFAEENIAVPDQKTDGTSVQVDKVCYGTCDGQKFQQTWTDKSGYETDLKWKEIEPRGKGEMTPEELQKSRALKEEPSGA
ncbi:MAG: hypothetical protein ACXVA9_03285 [Bdellovibrionales bacterium]